MGGARVGSDRTDLIVGIHVLTRGVKHLGPPESSLWGSEIVYIERLEAQGVYMCPPTHTLPPHLPTAITYWVMGVRHCVEGPHSQGVLVQHVKVSAILQG